MAGFGPCFGGDLGCSGIFCFSIGEEALPEVSVSLPEAGWFCIGVLMFKSPLKTQPNRLLGRFV